MYFSYETKTGYEGPEDGNGDKVNEEKKGEGGSQRDNKSVLSSATMGRTERTERRV